MKQYHIDAASTQNRISLKEIWDYRDLIVLYTRKNFVLRYSQTILGPLWVIVVPLLTSYIHMFVFDEIAGISTEQIPGFLFYLAGTAIWTFFANCVIRCSNTFLANASVFGKIYFPRLCIPISHVLTAFLEFLSQLLLLFLFCLYYCFSLHISIAFYRWLLLIPLVLCIAMLAIGVGTIISALTAKYRDLNILTGFGMQLWMYITPVVYPLSQLNDRLKGIVSLNPMTSLIELYRLIVFGTGTLHMPSLLYSLVFTAVVLYIGLRLFVKVEKTFMDTV